MPAKHKDQLGLQYPLNRRAGTDEERLAFDALKADEMFRTQMGEKVEPRGEFIQNTPWRLRTWTLMGLDAVASGGLR